MKRCRRCKAEWPTKDDSYEYAEQCEICGSKDSEYCTRDGTCSSTNPVYDG